LDTGADRSLIKVSKDFYDEITTNCYNGQGNFRNWEISIDHALSATGTIIQVLKVIKINGHKPRIDLQEGRPLSLDSIYICPVDCGPNSRVKVPIKQVYALVGLDVCCQYNFHLRLKDDEYCQELGSRRAEFLVQDYMSLREEEIGDFYCEGHFTWERSVDCDGSELCQWNTSSML